MSDTPDIQTGQDAAREAVKWATRAARHAEEALEGAEFTGMAHMWAHVSQALTAATPPLLGSDVPGRCSVTSESGQRCTMNEEHLGSCVPAPPRAGGRLTWEQATPYGAETNDVEVRPDRCPTVSESGQQCMLNEEHSGLCIPAPERVVQRAWEADAEADAEELEQKRAFRPDRCPTVSESGQRCMFNEDHWSPCIPVPEEAFLRVARIGVDLENAGEAGALPVWEADAEGRLDRLTLLTSRMARGVLDEEEHDELRSLIEELQTKVEVLLQGQCVHNKSKHDLAHFETVDLCVWCKLKAEGETDG